ncbi:MAG TPA: ATP-binding cassette domain-containing protein [Acidothermales bacterium]|nr:ATP-binding cassette domain-containing protein [Actinomycetes bacterium]
MFDARSAAITAVDLVKTYRSGRRTPAIRALDGLSLDVATASVFALLGPNGAGKSTTVRILTTLARPDSGQATVAGVDVERDPETVRRIIGLVSQKASTDPMATARENLVLAGRIHGMSAADARARATELLRRFDLDDESNRLARTFSGGMSRKLDVAIGLMHRPQVLFLDEPTTGLDPEARTEMWTEIDELVAQEDVTVLLTTHYLEEADHLADRLAIVDRGRLIVAGTPDELKSDLRGDTVHVELSSADATSTAVGLLTRLAGLRDIDADGRNIRARAERGARAVPTIIAALDDAGVSTASVTVARPSLDDVYLQHVGRSFAATEVAA